MANSDEKKSSPIKRIGDFLCSLRPHQGMANVTKKLLARLSNIQPAKVVNSSTDKENLLEVIIAIETLMVVGIWIILSLANPSSLSVDFLIAINLIIAITFFGCLLWNKQKDSIHPNIVLIVTFLRWFLGITVVLLTLNKEHFGLIIKASENALSRDSTIGFVLFMAISIFLPLIGRAAERIAEVYSRFSLESMPNRQMAIDSELNCGLSSPQEALTKRKELEKENLQCASMEGICKFAKWDAVATSIVSIIFIIASTQIGLLEGKQVYVNVTNRYLSNILAWFWGSQVPAFVMLASIAMSPVRKAHPRDKKPFDKSKAAIIAGVTAILFGLIPGMPWLLLLMGLLFCFSGVGFIARQKSQTATAEEQVPEPIKEQSKVLSTPEEMYQWLGVDTLSIHVGNNLIELVNPAIGGALIEEISALRRSMTLTFGYILPSVRICDSRLMEPNSYKIIVRGNTVAHGEVYPQHYMVLKSHWDKAFSSAPKEAFTGWEPNLKEYTYWLQKDYLEGLIKDKQWNKPYINPFQAIVYHLSETAFLNIEELLTKSNVRRIINQVSESDPQLTEELIPRILSISDLRKILINLLKEKVSVRDINYILERLEDFAQTTRDTDLLSEKIRICMSRQLCEQHATKETIIAIDLCPAIQKQMEESLQRIDDKFVLLMEPEQAKRLLSKILEASTEIYNRLEKRPVILCNPGIRLPLARLIQQSQTPQPVVMSYAELFTDFKTNILETIKLENLS